MKKLLALMIAALIILSLAACGGTRSSDNGGNTAEPTEPADLHISDDTDVLDMKITPPKAYATVCRSLDKLGDGTVFEKNLGYTFDDGSELTFATSTGVTEDQIGQIKSAIGEDKIETREAAGKSFFVFEYGSEWYAINQTDDVTYGIQYKLAEGSEDSAVFDKALEGVSFTDNKTSEINEEGLGDISYTLDSALNVASCYDDLEETSDGEMKSKAYTWRFGKDKDNIDFRFVIRVEKGKKLEDELDEKKTYDEKEIGGLTWTAFNNGDGEYYDYYIQHGGDVYIVKNIGVSTGWGTTRSDESFEAFGKLMDSISFK